MIPSNSASSGTISRQEASQTTFTDLGGNGPIPTPPPGQTAVRYSSAFEMPAQSITFNSSIITLTASAPCEITAGHTYVVYVYANGGGLSHSELSPTTGTATTESTNSAGNIVLTFTLDLSKNSVPNFQPENTGTETVIAQE